MKNKILISLAGGSIPGGLFMAGVIEEIIKYFFVKNVSGASSGALNAVALMSGYGENLSQMWLKSLNQLNGFVTFNPLEIIKNNSFFKIQEFTDIIFEKLVKDGYLKSCHNTLVVYTKLNKSFLRSDHTTIADRLLFPLLILPSIRKSIGMTTETVNLENLTEKDKLVSLRASCCLPFFYGFPVKINKHIAFDGQMNQDLGGADQLLKFYSPGDYIALVFRYENGSSKNISRTKTFLELCKIHKVPLDHVMILAPEEKLPLSGHYDVNQGNFKLCIEAGRKVVMKNIEKCF